LRAILATTAVAVVLSGTTLAHADEPATETCRNVVDGSEEIDHVDQTKRLRWLDATLKSEATKADWWTYGWIAAGSAGTAVNVTLAATGDYGARIDGIDAAAGATMLTLTTLIDPLSVPAVGDGDSGCMAVQRRERLLASVALDEQRRQRWYMHLLPIAGVAAGFLVVGLGYDRWTTGALGAGIGIAASELKMLTQPTGAVRSIERYRSGVLDGDAPKVGWTVAPVPMGKSAGGLGLSLVF
jgi:hypothetical protein